MNTKVILNKFGASKLEVVETRKTEFAVFTTVKVKIPVMDGMIFLSSFTVKDDGKGELSCVVNSFPPTDVKPLLYFCSWLNVYYERIYQEFLKFC